MNKIKYLLIVLIIVALAVAGLFIWQQSKPSQEEVIQGLKECLPMSDMASKEKCDKLLKYITDFNTCSQAGFAIMESYPRQCRTVDGRIFIENIKVNLDNLKPTNFSKIGNLVQDSPGLKPGVPYLLYEEPGQPALSVELEFDDLSSFVSQGQSFIITKLQASQQGQRVALEGIEKDGQVLVRKIQEVTEETTITNETGSLFIFWSEAIRLMDQCQVKKIMQTHALDVYLTLKTGEKLRAVEPGIDDVFAIYKLMQDRCGKIPLGTE
jgi:hypothetical protein